MITPERRLSPGGFRREDRWRAGQNPAYKTYPPSLLFSID